MRPEIIAKNTMVANAIWKTDSSTDSPSHDPKWDDGANALNMKGLQVYNLLICSLAGKAIEGDDILNGIGATAETVFFREAV